MAEKTPVLSGKTKAAVKDAVVTSKVKAASKVVSASTKQKAKAAPKATLDSAGRTAQRRVDSARTTSRAMESGRRRERTRATMQIRPTTRKLAAEYLAAIVMATILLFHSDKSYHQKVSRFVIQITGISGIFFVLSLVGNSPKAAKVAVAFGLLIDLSMFLYIVNAGAVSVIGAVTGVPPKPNSDLIGPDGKLQPGLVGVAGQPTKYYVAPAGSDPLIPGLPFSINDPSNPAANVPPQPAQKAVGSVD